MAPIKLVVVVFPFVPVIATMPPRRKRDASSIADHFGATAIGVPDWDGFGRYARADHHQINLV